MIYLYQIPALLIWILPLTQLDQFNTSIDFEDSHKFKLYIYLQFVPHIESGLAQHKFQKFVLCGEIIGVHSDNHSGHINTLCEQKEQFVTG
jgi:hypothetical protein